jgi:hypothetical protein
MKEKNTDGQAREPPKFMRYVIWCSGGSLKNDALDTFDELFKSATEKFGYRHALLWGFSQCLRSFPRALWALIIKLLGLG